MSMPFSEAVWLCLAVTAGVGGIAVCKYKSPGQLGSQAICLAALWGGICLLRLSLFWILLLFSLSCFLLYMCSPSRELLPVDQKAILVTGVFPMQQMAAYSSSKAALTMFSSVMRQELSKWGVKVSVIHPGGFRTNIAGTIESRNQKEKLILDHLPPELQEDYGRDYILQQKDFLRGIELCSSDITPVIRDVEHAVSAQSPSAFYAPGKLTSLFLNIAFFFPTSFLDYFEKKQNTQGKGVPRALSTPK
ncbi:17-beta-hydroxysteroid dehydrogenase type 2 isoform X3 [Ictidomys tridecemlineatus]